MNDEIENNMASWLYYYKLYIMQSDRSCIFLAH